MSNVNYYIRYIQTLSSNNSGEVLGWCDTVLSAAIRKGKAGDQTEIEHVLDYLLSSAAPRRLRKMSYSQALAGAEKWTHSQMKKGKNLVDVEGDDIRTIHNFSDGTRIVELLTENAYRREGYLMAHCVGAYSPETTTIYSYRDGSNMPHATFEVGKDEDTQQITQIKGKGNGPIHPRYIEPILTFLRTIGMEVRPYDMRNLGYYHLSKEVIKMLDRFQFQREQRIVSLYGEQYVYST